MKIKYTETYTDYSKYDFEKMAAEEGLTLEEYYKKHDDNFESMIIKPSNKLE